jgi:hypothetical protein
MLKCRSEKLSANPIEPPFRMGCRITSGNDEKERTKEKKGKRNADKRVFNLRISRCGAHRSGALACRRSTAALTVRAFGP